MLVGQNIGPIRIEKELGSGAMGSVYRGIYTKTGQKVAIKVMAPNLSASPSALARFEREASILKQLHHPNIVRFYGAGKFQGMRFFAMEYIEGESLDHVMARRGRMTWEEVVTLGQQLCNALQHAHEKEVVHRDLKPSNLMVCPDGTLKLTDFGIAKDLDVTQLTEANCTVGTAAYMSPEQCRGEPHLSSKSDLYSLGVLFYELITGRKPFTADNAMDMFMKHVSGTFERPSRIVYDVPVWLDTLICQMLEKKPDQRPLNAEMISRVLGSIQEKVEAQQSAGVDAVRGRLLDRPKGPQSKIADEDKEAARILAGKGKKKKKKRGPFFQEAWFQAICIVALLIGIGFTLYLMLRPPSPDKLYEQAKKLMEAGGEENLVKARDGPIKTYLAHYGQRPGEETDRMNFWVDQIDIYDKENLLHRYLSNKKKSLPIPVQANVPAEEDGFKAIDAEEAGDLEEANKLWTKMTKDYGVGSGYSIWGKLAGEHLRMLDYIKETEKQLHEDYDKIGFKETQPQNLAATNPYNKDRQDELQDVFQGFRYQWFGDPFMANQQFDELREKYEKNRELRSYYVLARAVIRELKKKLKEQQPTPEGRTKYVKEKLDAALGKKETNEMRMAICLDIIALYRGKELDRMKEFVDRAQKYVDTRATDTPSSDP